MSENKTAALIVSAAALVVCSLSLYVQLLHERDHEGADYMPIVLSVVLFVVSVALVGWAVHKNLKDARRAESLRSQIVTIKDECRFQIEEVEGLHIEHLQTIASLQKQLEQIGNESMSVSVGGVLKAGPAAHAEERARQGGSLQDDALALARELVVLRKSVQVPPKTNYGFDRKEQKFATPHQLHAWHDVKRDIDIKLRSKYALDYQQKALRLYHRFVEAGVINQHLGVLADTLSTTEDLTELITLLRGLAFQLEDKE
jgi:hypothetical protein